ncbi:MAG: hypothetical protein LBC82_00600, partial [Oscillospiraceae bacterium]|nr:hypothetical protein [Oscillospiraceae bacterium]
SFFLAPYFAFFSRDTQKVSPLDTYTTNQKIENMLERYGYNDNIIIGKPIEIILGDENEGVSSSFGDFIFIDYLFQVTNNLTGNELPEFITVRSQLGTIFEIGKEYCISPMHINNALWDSHTIHSFPQFIPAEHLSRGEINRLKNAVWSRNDGDDPPLKVAESASLSPEFISSVDLAVEITVLDKLLQSLSTNVFNVNYELNNILHGEEYGHILTDWLRINTDVEVGGTYIVLLNVIDNAYTHPAARSGVVISKNSPEFAEYKKAFSS